MEPLMIISVFLFLAIVGAVAYQYSKRQGASSSPRQEPQPFQAEEDVLFDDLPKKRLVKETEEELEYSLEPEPKTNPESNSTFYCLYVMAEGDRLFQGYELLQALLAEDLRYGEMDIFHRYAHLNRRGEVLFSVASATEPGYFNIQNMGAVSVKGLCLFAQLTGMDQDDTVVDLMLDTAQNLASVLEGKILDQHKQPLELSFTD